MIAHGFIAAVMEKYYPWKQEEMVTPMAAQARILCHAIQKTDIILAQSEKLGIKARKSKEEQFERQLNSLPKSEPGYQHKSLQIKMMYFRELLTYEDYQNIDVATQGQLLGSSNTFYIKTMALSKIYYEANAPISKQKTEHQEPVKHNMHATESKKNPIGLFQQSLKTIKREPFHDSATIATTKQSGGCC